MFGLTTLFMLAAAVIAVAAVIFTVQGIRKRNSALLVGALACVLTLIIGYFALLSFITSM